MIGKCKDIEALLSAYMENDLPAEDAGLVRAHLSECPECRKTKEKMEEILSRLPDLQEEVPFFLKNRLYNIPEIVEKKAPARIFYFPKWLAAAIGTVILFSNLFYFTNIFPPANREMHSFVSSIEKLVVRTGGWFEKVKESKELLFFTFFNKRPAGARTEKGDQGVITAREFEKGGKNG